MPAKSLPDITLGQSHTATDWPFATQSAGMIAGEGHIKPCTQQTQVPSETNCMTQLVWFEHGHKLTVHFLVVKTAAPFVE